MRQLQKKLQQFVKKGGSLSQLSAQLELDRKVLQRIKDVGTGAGYKVNTLSTLYEHFGIENDVIFFSMLRKVYKPTESILGDIFRLKRIRMGRTIDQVADKINHGALSLKRLETGDLLPSGNSYIIVKLLELYEFDLETKERIIRFIALLRDMCTTHKSLDIRDDK